MSVISPEDERRTSPRLALCDWRTAREWAESPDQTQEAFVQSLIYPGVVHVVAGSTGIGKTYWAMQLAISLARGRPFLGWAVESPRPVLYVNLELPGWELAKRARVLGAASNIVLGNLRGLDVGQPDHALSIEAKAQEVGAQLVVIDTVTRAHKGDEQDASSVQQVMAVFEAWAARLGAGILLVHHTRKPSQDKNAWIQGLNDLRGSNAWSGHSGVAIVLSQNPSDANQYHAVFKNNFARVPPRQFRRQSDGTFSATAWNRSLQDEDVLRLLQSFAAPMSERKTAVALAKESGENEGTVRNLLRRMRTGGKLDGLWREQGKAILYGPASARIN